MMVLKGYGLSQYWPKPNHRQVGDLDIFLHYSSQNSELDLPACKHGDLLTIQKLGVKVDEGHEHHKCFLYKSISVENHYDFINIKAHKDAAKIESRLKSLSLNCFQMGSTNQAFLTSSATFNAIFLIRHMGQYFAGECVTLRQVLDWGLFLKHEGDKVTWSEVIPFLKKKGIWRFFQQINSICVDYLGIEMPKEVPALEREEQFERRILKDILQPEFEEQKTKELILY